MVIVEYAIVEFEEDRRRQTSEPTTLRTWWPSLAPLLHVSSAVRYLASKAFDPVVLQESKPSTDDANQPQQDEVSISRDLSSFMWAMAEYHLLDWSVKRHEQIRLPTIPPCRDVLTTAYGDCGMRAEFSVTVSWRRSFLKQGDIEAGTIDSTTCTKGVNGTGRDSICTIGDAAQAVALAWADLNSAPRPCNVFQRALPGKVQPPVRSTTIDTKLSLTFLESNEGLDGGDMPPCSRTWRFVTRRAHHGDA